MNHSKPYHLLTPTAYSVLILHKVRRMTAADYESSIAYYQASKPYDEIEEVLQVAEFEAEALKEYLNDKYIQKGA